MIYTLHHGDCLELMPSKISAGSVNLVLCDPPYGRTLVHWDKPLPFPPLWEQYKRLLAPGGCVILFGSQPFTSAVVMSNVKWFRHELIWDKNKCGSPGMAKKRPMKTHENILVFSPGRHVYNPIMEPGEPYHRKTDKPGGYVGRVNTHSYGLKPRNEFHNDGWRYPKSIRHVSRDFSAQQQVTATQKPVPLARWLIETYSNPGDLVLDNCFGSGFAGIACAQTGRPFIGIEKDPADFAIGSSRIKAAFEAVISV